MLSTILFNNSFPYIMIGIISTILFGYTLWKKKDTKLIVLYLSISGLIYIFEFVILVIFGSYEYYPGILKNKYFDNIFGSIFSNALTVPMTAVLISAFNFKLMGKTVAVFIITGIEELFLRIGIYEHYWWKTIYTTTGLYVLFYLSKKWYSSLRQQLNRWEHFITLFFINLTIRASITFILAGVLKLFFYKIDWFENFTRSHTAFSTTYIFFISLIFTTLSRLRLSIIWYVMSMIFIFIIDIVLLNYNILQLASNWNIFYFVPLRVIQLILVIEIDKRIIEK